MQRVQPLECNIIKLNFFRLLKAWLTWTLHKTSSIVSVYYILKSSFQQPGLSKLLNSSDILYLLKCLLVIISTKIDTYKLRKQCEQIISRISCFMISHSKAAYFDATKESLKEWIISKFGKISFWLVTENVQSHFVNVTIFLVALQDSNTYKCNMTLIIYRWIKCPYWLMLWYIHTVALSSLRDSASREWHKVFGQKNCLSNNYYKWTDCAV